MDQQSKNSSSSSSIASEDEFNNVTAEPASVVAYQAQPANLSNNDFTDNTKSKLKIDDNNVYNDQKPPVKIQTKFETRNASFTPKPTSDFTAVRASKESNEAKIYPFNEKQFRMRNQKSSLVTSSSEYQNFKVLTGDRKKRQTIATRPMTVVVSKQRPKVNSVSFLEPPQHNHYGNRDNQIVHDGTETDISGLLAVNSQQNRQFLGADRLSEAMEGVRNEEREAARAVRYWRGEHDQNFIYDMDRRMDVTFDQREPFVREMERWYSNDIKEHRRTFYIKQAMRQNDRILTIEELDRLELLKNYEDSWPCINLRKKIRRIAIYINMVALNIIKRKAFEACTIVVIMANCITLTMSNANQEPTESEILMENIFQALYTIEMVLKILGMGFLFNKGAYLRDYFNMLDFFIVTSAYLSMLQSSSGQGESEGLSLSSLRAFRVLRPLRAVNNIPGLRLIVQSIMSALPLLKDTIIVLLFFFLIFAIGGVNMFAGMLRQRCIEIETGAVMLDDEGDEVICGDEQLCEQGYFCGKRILNPNYDVTSFDSIFWALLTVFQCVTLEGWSDVMVLYQKVYTYYVFFFFVPLVFIGAFFLLNLTLAVINTSFNDAQERIKEAKEKQEKEIEMMQQTAINKDSSQSKKKQQKQSAQSMVPNAKMAQMEDSSFQELGNNKMGVHEYFIALKAARRLKEFARCYYIRQAEEEANRKRMIDLELKLDATNEAIKNKRVQQQSPTNKNQQAAPKSFGAMFGFKKKQRVEPVVEQPQSGVARDTGVNNKQVVEQHKSQYSSKHLTQSLQRLERNGSSQVTMDMAREDRLPNNSAAQLTKHGPNKSSIDYMNQTITEEDQSRDEKEFSNKSIQDFFKKLEEAELKEQIKNLDIVSQTDSNYEELKETVQAQFDEQPARLQLYSQRPRGQFRTQSALHSSSRQSVSLLMAFNDLRRANAHQNQFMLDANEKALSPTSNREVTATELLLQDIQKKEETEALRKKIRRELDFDHIMSQRRQLGYGALNTVDVVEQQPIQQQQLQQETVPPPSTLQTRVQVFEDQNQYDLSFIQRSEQDEAVAYHSDKDELKQDYLRRKSIIISSKAVSADEKSESSVIESDSSIKSQIVKYKTAKEAREREQAARFKQNTQSGKLHRDHNMKYKRMLTSDFTNRKPRFGDEEEDIMTIHGSVKFQKQMDCFSNLYKQSKRTAPGQEKVLSSPTDNSFSGASRRQDTPSDISQRSFILRKQKYEIRKAIRKMRIAQEKRMRAGQYKEFDKDIFSANIHDPYSQYDRKKQKITINPDVNYISTSQNDIFSRRINDMQQQSMYNFMRSADLSFDEQQLKLTNNNRAVFNHDVHSVNSDDYYVITGFQPHQLKNKLRIQQIEEVQFDANDEDTLILQQQPFETVMSIGHESFLNHLNTKFVARRSDIIVSSTLSITVTPEDDFQPAKFRELDADGIANWVQLRNEFRSSSIKSCNLVVPMDGRLNLYDQQSESEESEDEAEVTANNVTGFEQSLAVSSGQGNFHDQMRHYNDFYKKKLPRVLLSAPLSANQVLLLSEQDKRQYNIQKVKYEAEQRKMAKQDYNLAETTFDLRTAKDLVNGAYWQEETEEDKTNTVNTAEYLARAKEPNKQVFLGREGLMSEMRLDQFEKAVKKIITDFSQGTSMEEELMNKDHIPDDIKQEFNLPEDMLDNEVDFKEVRVHDASMAIKHPVWSGQEVLQDSLTNEQSKWITMKISAVRVWPKGFMSIVKKVRSMLKMFAMNPFFEHFMTLCVVINTVVMSMDRYDIDEQTDKTLSQMNEVFTYIFIFEMGTKLFAIGPKKYSASKWNLLDGGVVILSIIELIIESQSQKNSGGSSLSAFRTVKVFRTFRVMRVARILRALRSMQVIIGVITRSFRSFMYVILLLFVFVFIYALLGVQIYQGNYTFGPDEPMPRGNFEEFGIAFVTVFQVLTMENWQDVMYESMRSAKGSIFMKSLTAIYYVSWIFIGNFILLNLFLAILIDSFNSEEVVTKANADEELEAEKKSKEIKQQVLEEMKQKRRKKLGTAGVQKSTSLQKTQSLRRLNTVHFERKKKLNFTGTKTDDLENIDDLDELGSEAIRKMLISNNVITAKKTNEPIVIPLTIECENSIYLFHRKGCFRKKCYFVQQHRYFDRVIMSLIAISSLQLAFETYIMESPDDDPIVVTNLVVGDIINYSFVIEFLLKLVALGFVMEKGSYLRDNWNQLDFFILVVAMIDKSFSSSNIEALKILRMLRVLRPLRVVSHNVQLKMIVIALLDAAGSIVNVIIVVLVVWLMFAIFAVNTYKGMFFFCSVDKYQYQDKYECIAKGGQWLRYDSNFDDIGQAMMTLFVVSSLEGWPSIMHQALDITRVDYGPDYQNNVKQSIFFIFFILIGSFFFLNFFIGVLFLKYSEAQKREIAGFTEEQLMWKELQAMILKAKCPHSMVHKPVISKKWRLKVWKLVTSQTFEASIIVVIVLNMVQMAMTYEDSGSTIEKFMEITNLIFTSCFIIEAMLKLFAFGWAYFGTSWNKFDFFVVVASILDILLSVYQDFQGGEEGDAARQQNALSVAPQLARVLRVLRVSRLLRIAGHYKGLQSLFNTIMLSVSALFNVFMLLMLFFFMLAILGQFMFNGVKEGVVINEYKNFTVFDRSFLLLFSISTGEDWNRIMYDCSHTLPDCVEGKSCGSSFAPAYFIAFILLVTYVMLNLFILVIIQQFQKLYLDSEGPLKVFNRDYEIITSHWVRFTERHQCVKLKDKFIFDFMKAIPPPLGFSDKSDAELQKQVLKMNIKSEDGWIYFNELLYRILRNQYGKFTLNKNMQIRELITQYKLFNLTMKHITDEQQLKIDLQEKFFRKVGSNGEDTVNPFLTFMYFRLSFQAWRNYLEKYETQMRKQKEREDRLLRKKQFGFDDNISSHESSPRDSSPLFFEVEIDREVYSEWTVTSQEDSDEQTPIVKANEAFADLARDRFQIIKSPTISPERSQQLHRIQSKRRQSLQTFKFGSSDANIIMTKAAVAHQLTTNQYLSPETNRLVSRLFQSTVSEESAKGSSQSRSSRCASEPSESRSQLQVYQDSASARAKKNQKGILKRFQTISQKKAQGFIVINQNDILSMAKSEKE